MSKEPGQNIEIPAHFKRVEPRTFHARIWLQIAKDAEPVQSNWKRAKAGERPLRIVWGTKDGGTIFAVVIATEGDEQYWIDPALLSPDDTHN